MNAKPTAYPILGHNYSNGDARNRTEKFENTLERKSLYACHRQNEAETSEKYNKYKGDVNERNRERDSNPQRLYDTLVFQVTIYQILRPLFSILDTTILTDFRLHAHSL